MRLIKCDVCNNTTSEEIMTTINLGIVVAGSSKYSELCYDCAYWMIQEFDKRKAWSESSEKFQTVKS